MLDTVKRRREQKFARVSASSASVTAIHCPLADGNRLSIFREHGRIEIDPNSVEVHPIEQQ